ncbi:tyrosine-type recombinase/integrase [Clostridium sp. P21]|uniref:Tyrosine-type recombinase/integrase n=1 Tax=Clostridium muellerianum TaxID=2716538 RepID=A0A7Y0EFW6_9CLOT|nr:tyrosine-type recombinase/integrase [Clostridium muellerianum]NMM62741.1 tyrosine-type recombinase/integrase [Clostridium muellerianum]
MKTRVINIEEYKAILTTIGSGFTFKVNGADRKFRPNQRVKLALMLEGNLGVRIGDTLNLTLNSFRNNGTNIVLDIVEEKTGKNRTFTAPKELYLVVKEYALDNKLSTDDKLFPITERAVQKQLKIVCNYLGLENISTHSFRKFYANEIFNNNGQNIELVRALLQHSTIAITQKYLGVSSKEIESAISNHVHIV